MPLIFGVGVGLFIILFIWSLVLLLCCVSYRTKPVLGITSVISTVLVTTTLVLIPRDAETPSVAQADFKIYDKFFISRIVLIILVGLSAVVGFVLYLLTHLMEPRQAQPIKKWLL